MAAYPCFCPGGGNRYDRFVGLRALAEKGRAKITVVPACSLGNPIFPYAARDFWLRNIAVQKKVY